jgi:hypothetical protein
MKQFDPRFVVYESSTPMPYGPHRKQNCCTINNFQICVRLHHHQCFMFTSCIISFGIFENSRGVTKWLITFVDNVLCQHGSHINVWCIGVNMELKIPMRGDQNGCVHLPILDCLLWCPTFDSPFESFKYVH